MTQPDGPQDVPQDEPAGPQRTGVPDVDEALAGLTDLQDAPLSEQADRLARAHAALSAALARPDDTERPGSG